MLRLPSSEDSLLVRTDFSDHAAWDAARTAATAENEDGFAAYVRVVDDNELNAAGVGQLRDAARHSSGHAAVLFVVDEQALAEGHPVLVVDLSDKARPPFRCAAAHLWSVDNNLNLANMDWEEFADSVDVDGVHRGGA